MKNDKSSRQTEKKENHPRCEGCGRYHGGTKAECMCRNGNRVPLDLNMQVFRGLILILRKD